MDKPSKPKLIKLESKERYQRLLSKDSGSSGIKSGHVILKPGENIGEHSTAEREEIIIILNGIGEARIDKEGVLKLVVDSILYIPPQTKHDIKNAGREILEYIFVTSKI